MSKNIAIFSDGTGQAGGLRPDQRLSNVYKLYRAARIGPDSVIDPSDQLAFYDAGLGTAEGEASISLKTWRFVKSFIGSALGIGITTNIIDCYEAIIKYYEPGDRIFLFGFSRGAYTVRCVAGVMNLCGIPSKTPISPNCPSYGREVRRIAEEAVIKVYEHGAGKDRARYEPEREVQARRFRARYGSDSNGKANVAPYFIGVFDTVAALGASGIKRFLMNVFLAATLLALAAMAAWLASWIGANFLLAFLTAIGIEAVVLAVVLFKRSLRYIRDFPAPGALRWHLAGWHSGFYDRYLDVRVRYARHALRLMRRERISRESDGA